MTPDIAAFAELRDLEVIEDRSGWRATLVTSQVPVDHWHDLIGDATFGNAITGRLVHHVHRSGGSPSPPASLRSEGVRHAVQPASDLE